MGILDVGAGTPAKPILARKEIPHFAHIDGLFRDSTKISEVALKVDVQVEAKEEMHMHPAADWKIQGMIRREVAPPSPSGGPSLDGAKSTIHAMKGARPRVLLPLVFKSKDLGL